MTDDRRDDELAELVEHWGSAYRITRSAGGWAAKRKDGLGGWLTAPSAEALWTVIRADYQARPVSRDDAP